MIKIIGTIQGANIRLYEEDEYGHETVQFVADADIDRDGSEATHPNTKDTPFYDKWFAPDTTLHSPDGLPLDAYRVPYVVVPPLICQKTRGKVLGSECLLTNMVTKQNVLCVVGDIGPHEKIGEISPAAALAIGVDPDPMEGGEERRIIEYEIRVGKAALIDGVQYSLKSYGG